MLLCWLHAGPALLPEMLKPAQQRALLDGRLGGEAAMLLWWLPAKPASLPKTLMPALQRVR